MLQLEVPKQTPLQGQILRVMLGLQHPVDWVDLVSQSLRACLAPCQILIHWIRLCKILLYHRWCRASFPVLSIWTRYHFSLLSGMIMLGCKVSGFLTSLYCQILGLNPQLRSVLDSNPQLREMMQNPEFLRQLTSPETMQVCSLRLWGSLKQKYIQSCFSLFLSLPPLPSRCMCQVLTGEWSGDLHDHLTCLIVGCCGLWYWCLNWEVLFSTFLFL